MKLALFVLLFSLSLVATGQGYINPTDCYSYGNYTSCTASDRTKLTCSTDGYQQCTIEHPNGVSSGAGTSAISVIMNAIVEHKAQVSQQYAMRSIGLDLQAAVISSDIAALSRRLADIANEPSVIEAAKQSADIWERAASNASQFISQTSHTEDWQFYQKHKVWKEWYEASLRGACIARDAANLYVSRSASMPDRVKPSLDNLQHEAAMLDAACTSKEALKILAKAK